MSVRPQHCTPGFYRRPWAREWNPIEIIGQYPNGKFLVQEVGRPLPGRFLASRDDLRVDAGPSLRVVPPVSPSSEGGINEEGCGATRRGTEATPSCSQAPRIRSCRVCKAAMEFSAAAIKSGHYICGPCRRAYRRALSKTSQFAKDWQRERDRRRQVDPVENAKARARALARKAISRGQLIRQPCEVCAATTVEAHHDDYSKPLEVRWLCPVHHYEHHANEANNRGTRSAQ